MEDRTLMSVEKGWLKTWPWFPSPRAPRPTGPSLKAENGWEGTEKACTLTKTSFAPIPEVQDEG